MFYQLFIGAALLMTTVLFQALCFDFIIKKTRQFTQYKITFMASFFQQFWKAFLLASVTCAVSFVMITEVWIWALFYLSIDVMPDLESALYFSTSAFTTVGFGDIYLDKEWRLISSIEAMNGFLLFGWATAFIFEVFSHVYKREGNALNKTSK